MSELDVNIGGADTDQVPICQQVADTLEAEMSSDVAVKPNPMPTPSSQYVDLSKQPYGHVMRTVMEEHNAFISRVETEIRRPHIDDFEVRLWFNTVESAAESSERRSFQEFLEDEIMTVGAYTYDDDHRRTADIRVSEWTDGSGFICADALRNAVTDDRVGVRGVKDGYLELNDLRDEQ